MKTIIAFIIITMVSCSSTRNAANPEMEKIVESRNFTFIAQTALPARSSSINVSGQGYDLRIMNDSISVYLPFYGRATDIVGARNGGPIELKTKDFSYRSDFNKGRWNINIVPSGNTTIRFLNLSVSTNGYASLQVISTNRENISFNGIVESKK